MSFSCGSVYNLDSNTNPMCNLISPEELERGCYTLVFLLHRQFHNMFITFLFKENVLHFNGAICSYLLFAYPIQRIRNYKICTRRYKFVALMQIRQIAVVVGEETPRLANPMHHFKQEFNCRPQNHLQLIYGMDCEKSSQGKHLTNACVTFF